MDGGVDSLSLLAPGRRPALPQAAPRAGGRRRPRVRRGLAVDAGTRRRARSPTCTPRARSPCCPRSATPTPTSRTSRRATSGRSARWTPTCARAGSAARWTSSARPTTRCRASRSTASSRLAGDRAQPGGGDPQARGLRLLDARRLGPGGGAGGPGVHQHRALPARAMATLPWRRPRALPRSRAACVTRWRRWAWTASRPTRPRPPIRRARSRSRSGSRASPRCSPPGCRSGRPRSARRAATTRTPTRRSRSVRTSSSRSTPCSPSSATSRRAGSPTAC